MKHFGILTLFGATLFLSAALMFSFQPMIGKMLLPIVGGSPAGWMVALAFFQIALLVGYCAAHLLSRYSPRRQAAAYLGAICLGSLFLPVALAKFAAYIGDTSGPAGVFVLLTIAVAVPFVALSATSSTLQRLFTATGHPGASSPYFLYVASNLGSFAGLLLYPFLLEPGFGLTVQSVYWLFGYLFLIVAVCICLAVARQEPEARKIREGGEPPDWKLRAKWLFLAFVPSSLMMGLTSYASTEIVSMPLLWVIPLGLYLLTFVIAFSERKLVSTEWLSRSQAVAVILAMGAIFVAPYISVKLGVFGLHAAIFTIVALLCHVQLAGARPANSERDLTLFYLLLAAGGALGGVLNAFLVPLIFKTAVEYPVMLIIACFLNPAFRFRRLDAVFAVAAIALLFVKEGDNALFLNFVDLVGVLAIPIVVVTLLAVNPRVTIIASSLIAFCALQSLEAKTIYADRNFYGFLKVYDVTVPSGGGFAKMRYLSNGTTIHGRQSLAPGEETQATSYYTKDGPLGEVFSALKPKTVAAIGLGAGTVACYGSPDNKITFFEINPQDELVATKYFTFLSKCSTGNRPDIVLGDGRLALSHDATKYDLIILDAFSSDAVPTHLLTKEAIKLYLAHLNEKGILLFHISNRHFALGYPIVAEASALGLDSRFIQYQPDNPLADESYWVAVASDDGILQSLRKLPWRMLDVPEGITPWSDDYTNLLSVLRIGGQIYARN